MASDNISQHCKSLCLMFFLGFLLLVVSGCSWLESSKVTVMNVGPGSIDDVELEVGGYVIQMGEIGAGGSKAVTPKVSGDSSLRISYAEGDALVVCDGDVYFTNNLAVRVEVAIGGGVCRVLEDLD
ncbi:hypothetical protein [Stenotrophomonas indicatrix]|uniref:hypothetical protein n=1 Tax=Stenotrophomonas indicatrix TaxID=2045451 RepID=UPI00215A125B|nr:hypothetical protein [Stenotrophomonas indicatrix]MCR8714890.1 hypothetical protein [Stenotrophomonas indicatrix]